MAKKTAKKDVSPAKKVEEKAPSAKKVKLVKKGMARFVAAKGKVLPVVVGPKKLVRIVESDRTEINLDVIAYSAFNILKKAIKDGDIILIGGGQ